MMGRDKQTVLTDLRRHPHGVNFPHICLINHLLVCRLGAETFILQEHTIEDVDEHRFAVEVLVKLIPDNQEVSPSVHSPRDSISKTPRLLAKGS